MASFSSGEVVSRRTQPLTNDLSDTETVMLDVERGSYFGLQNVGKVIWEELAAPTTLDQLCERLMAQFDVDAVTCRREVGAFLEELRQARLIEVHGAGPAA
jgi:hypothetical protein